MQDTLIIVFTQSIKGVRNAYLTDLVGEDCFRDEDCMAGIVDFSSGGRCVSPNHLPKGGDILLISDSELAEIDDDGEMTVLDNDTEVILRHYSEQSERTVVVYHQGANNTKAGHKAMIEHLCEGKEFCANEAHSDSGAAFDALKQVKAAIKNSGKQEYDSAVKQIIEFACGNPILEAKLDLLHRLLVPPVEDSGDWEEIVEDWLNLMELVEADSAEKENKGQYSQAWEDFMKGDPQQYSDDPFNEKYCGSEDEEGMLPKLRDGLLATTP